MSITLVDFESELADLFSVFVVFLFDVTAEDLYPLPLDSVVVVDSLARA